jgi:hypothetical protein
MPWWGWLLILLAATFVLSLFFPLVDRVSTLSSGGGEDESLEETGLTAK